MSAQLDSSGKKANEKKAKAIADFVEERKKAVSLLFVRIIANGSNKFLRR